MCRKSMRASLPEMQASFNYNRFLSLSVGFAKPPERTATSISRGRRHRGRRNVGSGSSRSGHGATRQKTSDRRRRGRRQRRRGDTGARAAAASESLRHVSVCPHEPRRPGHALQQMPLGRGHCRLFACAVQGFRLVLSIGLLSWSARTRYLPPVATLVHKCFSRLLSCGSSFRDISRSHNSVKPHR